MRPRRIRTLTIALIAILAPGIASADAEGLRLKIERQLHMAPSRPERDSAKFIEADRIEGEQNRVIVATGHVVMRQRGAAIRADRLEYHNDDQTAIATGNVQLDRDGDTATGPRLTYRLDNETGEMDTPTFEFPKKEERRYATRGSASLAVLGENRISKLFRAAYTSCPVPREDWVLRVRELVIDGGRNTGVAYGSTVWFLGVPILYSPYISFPLDNKRKSGFLAPILGTSGRSGFEAALPYYWNIADNFDATFTPKVFTKRGVQLGGEFRYLEPKFKGILEGEILPDDRLVHENRYFLGLHHEEQLWHGWHALVNAQKVSDDNYFRDLSTKISVTSQTNLPRDFIVGYDDDVWSLSARALAYQTLQDPNAPPIPIPYRMMPRLLASGQQLNFHGIDWQFFGEYANFVHPTLVNGQRAILYPSLALPFRRSWGYVVPRIGYHMTRYELSDNAAGLDGTSRSLPIASVDAGLYFDRPFAWRGRDFQQTLEPRLYYLHVPFRDQSRLPNFTTAESDFNFVQLFSDNRFVGGDRIGDANQITMAVTSRLIESSTGLERLKAALGQVYYFTPPRVTLGETPLNAKSSDIVALASSQMSSAVGVDFGLQYTPSLSRSQKITLATHYSPEFGKILNAAYRYARGSGDPTDPAATGIQQVDLSGQWPIRHNLSGLARWNWSTQDHKLVEGLVGIEYNAGCWQLRAVAHRFITSAQQYSTSFQIQLELSGLSRIGIDPLQTLRQNIFGYRPANDIAP